VSKTMNFPSRALPDDAILIVYDIEYFVTHPV
jgi:hypothetical protein